MLNRIKTLLLLSLFLSMPFAPAGALAETVGHATPEPVYVVIMNQVEGDGPCHPGDGTCENAMEYQAARLPAPGVKAYPSFNLDNAGTNLIYELLMKYRDSCGRLPKLFIEPSGEWWQTCSDPVFDGKAFDKHEFLALGNEFGIQGHDIYYGGHEFGWYESPHTPDGISQKFRDLDHFADRAMFKGRKVNGGTAYTGGWKLEKEAHGEAAAEHVIDHAAFALGYRVSLEDHDGHIKDQPKDIDPDNPRPSYHVYRAGYDDGVQIVKIDINGSVTGECSGRTPRCETPDEAAARFDNTLAARTIDADPAKVYFFAFAVHAGNVWNDFNMAASGRPLAAEGLGLTRIMDHIRSRVNQGAKVRFVTPSELASVFEEKNPLPPYFIAVHNEPNVQSLGNNYLELKKLVAKANSYGMKLTLMFTPPWADFIMNDPARARELDIWRSQGHEIAGHHHSVWHSGTWDGYTYLPRSRAYEIRNAMGKHERYLGDLTGYTFELERLNRGIRSGCMNDEKDKNEMPSKIIYDTCSGYANFGQPGTKVRDDNPDKGKNEFMSVGLVNGLERKWLTHYMVCNEMQAAEAGRAYGSMTSGVFGTVTHSVASQTGAMIRFMDYLHTLDPNGSRSMTVAEVIESGLLREERIDP